MNVCKQYLACLLTILVFGLVAASPEAVGAPAAKYIVQIAIAGDSTVADYKLTDPHRGWGQLFPEFVNPQSVVVHNFAANGRSTKTFKSEGLWDKTLASQPNYVFIQFGHNDSHSKDHPEATEADTDYSANLREYVDTARAHGAIPILVTPMHRGTWDTAGTHLTQELLPYAAAMRRVAAEKKAPLVDLYSLSETAFEKRGKDQLETIFAIPAQDHTHFNEKGARLLAGLIAAETARVVPDLKSDLVLPTPLQSNGPSEATVAADGSGQYKTMQEAINAAPTGTSAHPSIIHVKPGIYHEIVYVQREKRFVRLLGENPATTVITYNLNANDPGADGKPIGTFRTATVTVDADDFTVENITLENSAGAVGQALALRVDGDRVTFRHCRFLGWQDTILANRGRHYFDDCDISGAVDFIFGAATAYFNRCRIHCLGKGYITAASTPSNQAQGFVFSHCTVDAPSPDVKTYLGRPWRDFADVTFLNTELSAAVRPEGWSNWNATRRDQTARYAEFQNTGPGAGTAKRVPWAKQLTPAQARLLTPAQVLGGPEAWNPAAGQ